MRKRQVSALLALLCPFAALATPPSYTITDLGTLAWATVNPVPGSAPNTTEYEWTPYGEVGADAISGPGGPVHAYLYRSGQLTDLGVLPGAMGYTTPASSIGRSLNSMAHVVGVSNTEYYSSDNSGKPATHAVMWKGAPIDLGTLSGDPTFNSIAEGVNDSDEVVGTSTITLNSGQVTNRAFVWIAGTMYNLSFYINSTTVHLTDATAINCQGQIAAVGYNGTNVNQQHAYLLTRVGKMRSCP